MSKSFFSFEIVGYCLVILITVPFAWEANKLPPGVFDPLGSGTVPLVVSLLILALCVLGLIKQWIKFLKQKNTFDKPSDEVQVEGTDSTSTSSQDEPFVKTPHLVFLLLGASIIYCLAFQLRIANFIVLSTFFLWISIFMLSDRSRKHIFRSLLVALVCSTVFFFVFTKIFVVDLPGS